MSHLLHGSENNSSAERPAPTVTTINSMKLHKKCHKNNALPEIITKIDDMILLFYIFRLFCMEHIAGKLMLANVLWVFNLMARIQAKII